jgi:hypothetical protein
MSHCAIASQELPAIATASAHHGCAAIHSTTS